MKKLIFILSVIAISLAGNVKALKSNACNDANIFANIVNDVCWSCFLPVRLMGVGPKPEGAADSGPVCACQDRMGIPEFGYSIGFWQPARLVEHVRVPWCAAALGGIKLQDDLFSLSSGTSVDYEAPATSLATYQYHYYSYPLFAMLEILYIPDCSDDYTDLDMMYLSELDPTWNNDLLSILLSPEAFIFGTQLAKAWCTADCASVTAGEVSEVTYGCAGCDGSLYPFTGNVMDGDSGPRVTSLLTQRVLASLHRKGLARKTIGDAAMCEPEFWPIIPRSQYKLSMLHPVAEADKDSPSGQCCHPLGESEHKWSTAAGGRTVPGKEDAVYLIWRFTDCCVKSSGINAPIAE